MINWTPKEKETWDDLIVTLRPFNYPPRVGVRRRAAILKADEMLKGDARFTVSIPENDWREDDKRGVNHERWFVVSLYIDTLRRALEEQGFNVNEHHT